MLLPIITRLTTLSYPKQQTLTNIFLYTIFSHYGLDINKLSHQACSQKHSHLNGFLTIHIYSKLLRETGC